MLVDRRPLITYIKTELLSNQSEFQVSFEGRISPVLFIHKVTNKHKNKYLVWIVFISITSLFLTYQDSQD